MSKKKKNAKQNVIILNTLCTLEATIEDEKLQPKSLKSYQIR